MKIWREGPVGTPWRKLSLETANQEELDVMLLFTKQIGNGEEEIVRIVTVDAMSDGSTYVRSNSKPTNPSSMVVAKLKERGIDLDRLTQILESSDNWDHLVHAFEVLTILEAVKAEMEAMQ